MSRGQAYSVAAEIRSTYPTTTYTDIAYSYSHGAYAVIVYRDGDIVVLIDADAAASYLLNHPPTGSD